MAPASVAQTSEKRGLRYTPTAPGATRDALFTFNFRLSTFDFLFQLSCHSFRWDYNDARRDMFCLEGYSSSSRCHFGKVSA
jgi:hypothetical protein